MTSSAAACVDYNQSAEDHQSLLVLVRHVGSQLSSQNFNHVFDKISRINCIHVEGQKRDINIKYRRTYSLDFNSWGEFQGHRKVLGLITIGKCKDHPEFDALFTSYKSVKEEYSSSIINSRLVVFGMNTDGSPIVRNCTDDNGNDSEVFKDSNESDKVNGKQGQQSCDNKQSAGSEKSVNNNSSLTSPAIENSRNGPLKALPEDDEGIHSDDESGSSPSSVDKSNKISPTIVSHENSGFKGSTLKVERRPNRSNSLTKESTGSEIVFYPDVEKADDLDSRMKEFVTSLYYVLEGKRLDRSFERSDKLTLLCAPFEKKDYVGVDTDTKSFRKKCMGRLRKQLGDLCLQAALPGEAVLHYNTALDMLKTVNDFLWMGGCLEGLSCASVVLSFPKPAPLGLRRNQSFQTRRLQSLPEGTKNRTGSSFGHDINTFGESSSQPGIDLDDIIDKYKEAITYYLKFKNAAAIEIECCLKACRFLILQKRYLQASDFLQNVVYITLPTQEDDRIMRYITLSSLYNQIGFKRKAAFFHRICGMYCVNPDSSPSWSQCHDLLLECLEGYGLSINPREFEKGRVRGWPQLQLRVLNELVFAARRTCNPQVAVRHMTLLVHYMLPHLNVNEQRESLSGLSTLTLKCPGTPLPIALNSGLILPPVALLSLPYVRSFKLLPPSHHLQPHNMDLSANQTGQQGVFIYTPIVLQSSKKDDSKPDFKWVCGDVCEASLQLVNPLADELKIMYLGLMTSEVDCEIFPASPILPPDSGLMTVKLMLKPKSSGMLKVLGYSTLVFGCKSNCKLRDLCDLKPSIADITIEVIPPLPQIALSCSLPKSSIFTSVGRGADVAASGSAVLFAGQSTECVVTLQNISEFPMESLDIQLKAKGAVQETISRMIMWSEDNVTSQLPVLPGHQLCFTVCIQGESDFMPPMDSGLRSPMSQSSQSKTESLDGKSLDAILCLQYSGGEGMKSGFCRKCSLSLSLDVLPCLYIVRWDLQPTDSPFHCRFLLDLLNVAGQQIEVHYSPESHVTLEAQQTKRIAIEVSRLDPSSINVKSEEQENCIPSFYRQRSIPDPYSQFLASTLDIGWKMPSIGAQGKVVIDYIKWTQDQLSLLMLPNFQWDVQLNSQRYLPSSKLQFPVTDIIELSVTVKISSENWPDDSFLLIEVCQNQAVGDLPLDPKHYAVIGSSDLPIQQVAQENECVSHSCCFSFFSPGWYSFNLFFSPTLRDASNPHDMTTSVNSPTQVNESSQSTNIGEGSRGRSNQDADSLESGDLDKSEVKLGWHFGMPVRFEVV